MVDALNARNGRRLSRERGPDPDRQVRWRDVRHVPAVELGGVAIRAAVERSGLPADTPVDEVIMGQVIQAGVGQAPARQAALSAGCRSRRAPTTINKVCGSGLKAIMFGAAEIRAGDAEVIVAGGMESMNGAPYMLPRPGSGIAWATGRRRRDRARRAVVRHRGLPCRHARRADRHQRRVSREDQDAFALRAT